MAKSQLENRWMNNLFILYATIFGSAFCYFSAVLLLDLCQIETGQSSTVSPILVDNEKTDQIVPLALPLRLGQSQFKIQEWQWVAKIGLGYGIACFFALVCHLWSRQIPGKSDKIIDHVPSNPTPEEKGEQQTETDENDWTEKKSGYNVAIQILIGSLCMTSILVPTYVAVNIYTRNVIQVASSKIKTSALILFATCALSLMVVIGSACAVIYIQFKGKGKRKVVVEDGRNYLDVRERHI